MILDKLNLAAGAIVGAALMTMPACMYGQHIQRQATAVESLSKSVGILRSRNTIDEEVSAFDAAALCRSYSLSEDDIGECVRRVVDADANARNSR